MSRKAKAIHNVVARHGVPHPSQLDCAGLVHEIMRSAWWLRMQATSMNIELERSRLDGFSPAATLVASIASL